MINPGAPYGGLQNELKSNLAKLGDPNDPTLNFMNGINWGSFDAAALL